MNSIERPAAVALCILLVSGCAAGSGPRAIPDKAPPQCQFDQQLICTGKSATRIKGESNDVEFCHCQRIDKIR